MTPAIGFPTLPRRAWNGGERMGVVYGVARTVGKVHGTQHFLNRGHGAPPFNVCSWHVGRLHRHQDPLGHVTTTIYNAAGEVQATVDQLGQVTTYTYDLASRRVGVPLDSGEMDFRLAHPPADDKGFAALAARRRFDDFQRFDDTAVILRRREDVEHLRQLA